jgi:hypothetical protein
MATPRPSGSFLAGSTAALLLGLVGCTAYPSAPAGPAYDTDVLPIFAAHCNRCHGDAVLDGGVLYNPGFPLGSDAGFNSNLSGLTAYRCYLGQYGFTGDPCPAPSDAALTGPNDCRWGAAYYATQKRSGNGSSQDNYIYHSVHRDGAGDPMPLAPAPALNDYELSVVDSWLAETPIPICSRSSNPDPALHCETGPASNGYL